MRPRSSASSSPVDMVKSTSPTSSTSSARRTPRRPLPAPANSLQSAEALGCRRQRSPCPKRLHPHFHLWVTPPIQLLHTVVLEQSRRAVKVPSHTADAACTPTRRHRRSEVAT